MKKIGLGILLLDLCVFLVTAGFNYSTLRAADAFEGLLSYEHKMGNSISKFNFLVKPENLYYETSTRGRQKIKAFADFEKNKRVLFVPKKKEYVQFPVDESPIIPSMEPAPEQMVIVTGETKKIKGLTCYRWLNRYGDKQIEVWVALNFAKYAKLDWLAGNRNLMAWQNKIVEKKGFPIEIYEKDRSGTILSSTKLVKMKRKKVGKRYFKIPSRYKSVSLSEVNSNTTR